MDKRFSRPRVPPPTKWHESSREALLRTTRVVSGALQMAKTSKTASKTKGALTDAAAWILAQPVGAQDLW
jgi:hypothetical protein